MLLPPCARVTLTAPLTARPPELLSAAEEALALTEVEVALRQLGPQAQEALQGA